ncbi:hypothetical protein [Butyrivibrio sp. AE3004]|uniref:hypothetical protein n=1 Tax=Butyrivibrio sp. AE3004 TaxID=1506994 RepID=UPI000494D61F|nr:hypothetical protein [Butyrivibrio sp. AE3004]
MILACFGKWFYLDEVRSACGISRDGISIEGIFHDDISIAYLVPSDDTASEVLKEAFGDKATFDGTSYILSPGISRKKEMVPAISEVLEAYPKED